MLVAGSFYLLSTAVFSVAAVLIGVRLVRIWRRSGRAPEGALGLGLMLTAGFGYGAMMIGIIGNQQSDHSEPLTAVFTLLTTTGWVLHNLGVMCMIRFIVLVFHPGSQGVRLIAIALGILLWTGWGGYAFTGGMSSGVPHGGYWLSFLVIGTYPIWTAIESLRYYRLMRRRQAIGLSDALVTNRFLVWGIASLCAAAAIWTVNIPAFMGLKPGAPGFEELTAMSMFVTSGFGTVTLCLYGITFFPPAWYRRRLLAL